jgi:hypothetical protein
VTRRTLLPSGWGKVTLSETVYLSPRPEVRPKRGHAGQPLGQLSPSSPRMPIVVEVAPRGLISPLSYVVDSIRFFDSTPLPYQRQRPHRPTEKKPLLQVTLGLHPESGVRKLSDGSNRISAYPSAYKGPPTKKRPEGTAPARRPPGKKCIHCQRARLPVPRALPEAAETVPSHTCLA